MDLFCALVPGWTLLGVPVFHFGGYYESGPVFLVNTRFKVAKYLTHVEPINMTPIHSNFTIERPESRPPSGWLVGGSSRLPVATVFMLFFSCQAIDKISLEPTSRSATFPTPNERE